MIVFWFIICRTIFTGIKRYNYLDTTYAFTVEEEKQRQQHKQIYTNLLIRRRQTRLQKIKERYGVSCIFWRLNYSCTFNQQIVLFFFLSNPEKITDVDLGMIPAHGLVPPTLSITELKREFSETKDHNTNAFPATRKSIQDVTSLTPKVSTECRFDETSLIIYDNTWFASFLQLLRSAEETIVIPSKSQEVADCSRTLTPRELYRVDVG